MEQLEAYSPRSDFMAFLPAKETLVTANPKYAIAVLATIDKDVDVIAQMEEAFQNFIETGQVWALLIGLVLGYIFRSFTAY
jgi:hypothetical protein